MINIEITQQFVLLLFELWCISVHMLQLINQHRITGQDLLFQWKLSEGYQQHCLLLELQCLTVHLRQPVNHHISSYTIEITQPLMLLLFELQSTTVHMLQLMLLQCITVHSTQLVNQQ